ncbi:uncharacterized protein LOC112170710 [Rosa chinensis]|uniref:uncharacterized protein LOC112170710 n=1 Tax=Rosa chinensis TaxID=74649 RepID=UPI000D089304|nr:uncharacterized protein LOC112170710 [Rosa chinensis]
MDFMDGLPPSDGKNAILVVVDRLSKYGHFIPISHPYTATHIAEVFMKEVFRLHGMPKSIFSDRDPVFLSHFWTAFFKLQADHALQDRNVLLQLLKDHMVAAQNRMKTQADLHRTEREFNVGDWVFLKLQPYRQRSLVKRPYHKLSPRYYSPFLIKSRIGKVAYTLDLPAPCRIHPIFHVSLLKKRIGDGTPLTTSLPDFDDQGELLWHPDRILDMAIVRKKKRNVTHWLVQWAGLPAEDATWEEAHTIKQRFPSFCA